MIYTPAVKVRERSDGVIFEVNQNEHYWLQNENGRSMYWD